MRRLTPARAAMAAAPIALALTIAACGSSSSSNNKSSAGGYGGQAATVASKPAASVASTATIAVGHTHLGNVLVDVHGRTLYVFSKDTGAMSTCNGACAGLWPPVTSSGSPKAGAGVSAAKLGTSMRADGAMQVTWAGHPVYRFSGDKSAGQTGGQGLNAFGGVWHAVPVSSAHASKKQHKQTATAGAGTGASTAPVHQTPAPAAAPRTQMPVHRAPAPMHSATPAPAAAPTGIPQNNGGDMDSDNNGGPSDGDGNI